MFQSRSNCLCWRYFIQINYKTFEKIIAMNEVNKIWSHFSIFWFFTFVKKCFKSISNPRCIDLFSTNNALSFQSTKTVSTGLLDFHKLILTVLKTSIIKNKAREIQYKNNKYFDSRKFNRDLKEEFSREYVDPCSKLMRYFWKF